MNFGSIGEIPPRTFGRAGFTCVTAAAAAFTMSEKIFHSGSSSKFQCDLLFGSFQNITASTMGHLLVEMATDVHFLLGVIEDLVTRTAQHRLDTRSIWHPPICRVVRI